MKRVCHFAIATHLGGGERSLLELARGQMENPAAGYEPWVLLPKSEGPLVDELDRAGVPHETLPLPRAVLSMSRATPAQALRSAVLGAPGMSWYFPRLLALLLRRRIHLIHTNAIKCHALGAIAGEILRRPVLWHLRDILPPGPTLSALRALNRLPGVHVVGNSKATVEAFGTSGAVVYNGIRLSEYLPKRNRDFNHELRVGDDVPVVGVLGVLERWKGQVEFLRMASELVGAGVNAVFVVVGDSIYDTRGAAATAFAYKSELQDLVDHLGLRSRVHFTGFRNDVARALNGLDVLVHASIRPEPFGRVVIEAMACGVPVVATASGGVAEIVEKDKTGLLAEPGDFRALAREVRRILADPALARALAEQGRRSVESRFTHERYVKRISEVYDAVLSS